MPPRRRKRYKPCRLRLGAVSVAHPWAICGSERLFRRQMVECGRVPHKRARRTTTHAPCDWPARCTCSDLGSPSSSGRLCRSQVRSFVWPPERLPRRFGTLPRSVGAVVGVVGCTQMRPAATYLSATRPCGYGATRRGCTEHRGAHGPAQRRSLEQQRAPSYKRVRAQLSAAAAVLA